MATKWVDFNAIKAAVTMLTVLDHYNIKGLVKSDGELRGPCPIHKGSQRTKTFTVNVSKNAFKCFSDVCNARGNVLDFVVAMERCSVRDAALKLQEWFKVGESVDSESDRSDELTTPNAIESIRKLFDEIEEHNSQIASLASMIQIRTAAVKELVANLISEV
ncbi:MAG TPA: CHC2 zinc finger domain-containing protein [Pyrinomonadaceae bacterium]|nr:CHC2 zinc finger domain-containing protein [Pyrinomonadaceae bacterium]